MTAGELKFALLVENVLNHIPQPEYRQLVVETMVILSLISDARGVPFLSDNIRVDRILDKANALFYEDMVNTNFACDMKLFSLIFLHCRHWQRRSVSRFCLLPLITRVVMFLDCSPTCA